MDLTILEIHVDDASFSADRPFSNLAGADEEEDTGPAVDDSADDDPLAADDDGEPTDESQTTDSPERPTAALAAVGVLAALVGVALALRRFVGGEDPDVDIETPEDDENRPVGVAVDE
jgi:hypothetical protein